MTPIIPKKSVAIFLCVFLINTWGLAETRGIEKVYNMPLAEVEDIVSSWLRYSGFDIYRTPFQMGQVKLYAENQKQSWQIILRHHSPLATRVIALYVVDNQTAIEPVENLWHYLSEYVKGSLFEKGHFKLPVPPAVTAKMKSVVCVHVKADSQDIQLSGFIVDEKGMIISTAHDLEEIQGVSITLYDGRQIKGKVVKIDPHRDLILVDVGIKLDNPIRLNNGRNLLGLSEPLFSVGYPINHGLRVYSGIVNSPPRRVKDLVLWQVNMTIHPGSSGSPVFDINGNLVAIIKGRYRGTESVGFLIPFETLLSFLEET
ncbi:MAG: serine protease [Thermodesulfobacteriota bacterium]|nr:serine protease [Thermodesulfobacteriota bacterium]